MWLVNLDKKKELCSNFKIFQLYKQTNLGRLYIFYSDLVWRMQLMIIKGKKFVLCVGNFVYQKSLKRTFKPSFEYKIAFWICVLVMLWIHKVYCVVKKLVWNLRIKAFWYTKYFSIKYSSHTAYFVYQIKLINQIIIDAGIRKETWRKSTLTLPVPQIQLIFRLDW